MPSKLRHRAAHALVILGVVLIATGSASLVVDARHAPAEFLLCPGAVFVMVSLALRWEDL